MPAPCPPTPRHPVGLIVRRRCIALRVARAPKMRSVVRREG